MRTLSVIALYAFAIAAIYAAFHIAPDMTWPRTDSEFTATALLVLGCLAKLAGHAVTLSGLNSHRKA